MASLLGTGVTFEGRLGVGFELEWVLSLRCRGSSCFNADEAGRAEGVPLEPESPRRSTGRGGSGGR